MAESSWENSTLKDVNKVNVLTTKELLFPDKLPLETLRTSLKNKGIETNKLEKEELVSLFRKHLSPLPQRRNIKRHRDDKTNQKVLTQTESVDVKRKMTKGEINCPISQRASNNNALTVKLPSTLKDSSKPVILKRKSLQNKDNKVAVTKEVAEQPEMFDSPRFSSSKPRRTVNLPSNRRASQDEQTRSKEKFDVINLDHKKSPELLQMSIGKDKNRSTVIVSKENHRETNQSMSNIKSQREQPKESDHSNKKSSEKSRAGEPTRQSEPNKRSRSPIRRECLSPPRQNHSERARHNNVKPWSRAGGRAVNHRSFNNRLALQRHHQPPHHRQAQPQDNYHRHRSPQQFPKRQPERPLQHSLSATTHNNRGQYERRNSFKENSVERARQVERKQRDDDKKAAQLQQEENVRQKELRSVDSHVSAKHKEPVEVAVSVAIHSTDSSPAVTSKLEQREMPNRTHDTTLPVACINTLKRQLSHSRPAPKTAIQQSVNPEKDSSAVSPQVEASQPEESKQTSENSESDNNEEASEEENNSSSDNESENEEKNSSESSSETSSESDEPKRKKKKKKAKKKKKFKKKQASSSDESSVEEESESDGTASEKLKKKKKKKRKKYKKSKRKKKSSINSSKKDKLKSWLEKQKEKLREQILVELKDELKTKNIGSTEEKNQSAETKDEEVEDAEVMHSSSEEEIKMTTDVDGFPKFNIPPAKDDSVVRSPSEAGNTPPIEDELVLFTSDEDDLLDDDTKEENWKRQENNQQAKCDKNEDQKRSTKPSRYKDRRKYRDRNAENFPLSKDEKVAGTSRPTSRNSLRKNKPSKTTEKYSRKGNADNSPTRERKRSHNSDTFRRKSFPPVKTDVTPRSHKKGFTKESHEPSAKKECHEAVKEPSRKFSPPHCTKSSDKIAMVSKVYSDQKDSIWKSSENTHQKRDRSVSSTEGGWRAPFINNNSPRYDSPQQQRSIPRRTSYLDEKSDKSLERRPSTNHFKEEAKKTIGKYGLTNTKRNGRPSVEEKEDFNKASEKLRDHDERKEERSPRAMEARRSRKDLIIPRGIVLRKEPEGFDAWTDPGNTDLRKELEARNFETRDAPTKTYNARIAPDTKDFKEHARNFESPRKATDTRSYDARKDLDRGFEQRHTVEGYGMSKQDTPSKPVYESRGEPSQSSSYENRLSSNSNCENRDGVKSENRLSPKHSYELPKHSYELPKQQSYNDKQQNYDKQQSYDKQQRYNDAPKNTNSSKHANSSKHTSSTKHSYENRPLEDRKAPVDKLFKRNRDSYADKKADYKDNSFLKKYTKEDYEKETKEQYFKSSTEKYEKQSSDYNKSKQAPRDSSGYTKLPKHYRDKRN